jgi:hypothetical protein
MNHIQGGVEPNTHNKDNLCNALCCIQWFLLETIANPLFLSNASTKIISLSVLPLQNHQKQFVFWGG